VPNIELGAGGREQLALTVYVWVVVFFEEPGLRHVTKSYRLDTSGRSEDKEAAAIAPIVRKACDICTVGHALRNPTHLLRRSADCEPYPRLQIANLTLVCSWTP